MRSLRRQDHSQYELDLRKQHLADCMSRERPFCKTVTSSQKKSGDIDIGEHTLSVDYEARPQLGMDKPVDNTKSQYVKAPREGHRQRHDGCSPTSQLIPYTNRH